jgi:hypothetical protein
MGLRLPELREVEPSASQLAPSTAGPPKRLHVMKTAAARGASPLSSRRRPEFGHLRPSLPLVSTYLFRASAESLDACSPNDDDARSSRPLPVLLRSCRPKVEEDLMFCI